MNLQKSYEEKWGGPFFLTDHLSWLKMTTVLLFATMLTACSHTYYVVRHAEKQIVSGVTDPSLTEAGQERAITLRETLKDRHIRYIFSTHTVRTESTAKPLSEYMEVPIQNYAARPDSLFIGKLRHLRKNVLIVGHSNTVDDIVNALCKEVKISKDLDDSEYNNLFIITYKGKKIKFEKKTFGN